MRESAFDFKRYFLEQRFQCKSIGFGDVIVPAPINIEYPTLLDFPPPHLAAYPKEAVIAEKVQALTDLGLLNSRLKDYFDIWLLSRLYDFQGSVLVEAIEATFPSPGHHHRGLPIGLTDAFSADPARQKQWIAFLRRSRFESAPTELQGIVEAVREFLQPPLSALMVESVTLASLIRAALQLSIGIGIAPALLLFDQAFLWSAEEIK